MKQTKRSFALSLVSLILCFSMLLGSTWAWFTDSVTSTGNVIKSGTLDVTFEWMEGNLDPSDKDSSDWMDASTGTIFNSELWEPGYTEVKHIKIENEGSLALKYVLDIIPYDEYGNVLSVDGLEVDGVNLAKAIDVYYLDPAMQIATRDDLVGISPICTLYDALKGLSVTGNGTLLSGDLETITLALKMRESAGNEYQDKSIGASFAIRLMATQYTKEADSFDENYDTDSKWPIDTSFENDSVSADVTPTVDNKVAAGGVSLTSTSGKISANIPEGVLLADNTSKVTLSVSDVAQSEANITLSETEATLSVDVHIEGISENNDTVIAVDIDELLPVGLNMGNYRFYHVENGATVEMTLLENGVAPVHNNYAYDPTTGDVTLYLKSFSEVAVVADTENAWEGEFDYDWYNADETEYTIANADQLAAFGAIVGGMNGFERDDFADKTVKLIADVNLGDKDNANEQLIFHPIGYFYENGASTVYSFEGVFDGNGHSVSNFYQNTWEIKGDYDGNYYKDAMGLFGYVVDARICNLTVDNFSSDGEFTPTGVIAAYAVNSEFSNIAITNCNPRVYNTGNGGIVGIGGNSTDASDKKLIFTNITVDNTNKISALWGSWDVACGGIMGMFRGYSTVTLTNCSVAAQIDVFNDVCGNYQYYWYRYAGMVIGSLRGRNVTDADGYTVPDMTGITAENCTVHFGNWNDYYYCELVANSLASYTHDHQFSRLDVIDSLAEIKDGENWTKAGNFLLIEGDKKTCYHIVKKDSGFVQHLHTDAGEEVVNGETVLKEDKQIVYLPFNQLFQGDGWGVKHIPIYDDGETYFEGITILDREIANSRVKFKANYADNAYRVGSGSSISIGWLFDAVDGIDINDSGVWVSTEKVNENTTVASEFFPDKTNWKNGMLSFSGNGAIKLTIQDYDYCIPTSLIINVDEDVTTIQLDSSKTYQYAPITVLDESEWEWSDIPASSAEFVLENGLYILRDNSGAENYVHVYDRVSVRDDLYYINEEGKLATYSTGTDGNSESFDVGYWSSSSALIKTSSDFYVNNLARIWARNGINIEKEDSKAFDQLLNINSIYSMKPTQVVPISALESIKVGYDVRGNMSAAVLEGMTSADYTARIRVYVTGSDVPYYDIDHKWKSNVDFASSLPQDAHGFVTAIQFFPFAFIPEGAHIQDGKNDNDPSKDYEGRYLYFFTDLYYFNVAERKTIGDFETEGYLDGYRITGLDPSERYAYSSDLISWTNISENSRYINVKDSGTYYIKVVGYNAAFDSEIKTIVVGGIQPAVTNLVLDGDVITGLDADKKYEYGVINYKETEWISITGVTEIEVTEGVWAVRFAADGTTMAGAPQYLTNKDEDYGTISYGKVSRESDTFLPGYWVSGDKTISLRANRPIIDNSNKTVDMPLSWVTNYSNRDKFYYLYTMDDSEVIPLKNLAAQKIYTAFGAGKGSLGTDLITFRVRVYVSGGDVEFYDCDIKYKSNKTSYVLINFDPQDYIPEDANGYVTAIQYYPLWEADNPSSIVNTDDYPVFAINHYIVPGNEELEATSSEKYRAYVYATETPEVNVEKCDSMTYYNGYKITGLNQDITYEVSNPKGEITEVCGVTEIVDVVSGIYSVRVKPTDTQFASRWAECFVPMVNPVFGTKGTSVYSSVSYTDSMFVDGQWVVSPYNRMYFDGNYNVFRIAGTTKLSSVYYSYGFYEADRFNVDDHPWIYVDFNNEMIRMQISSAVISGAIFAIDIYVEGEDEPYTIETKWKGYAFANKKTSNQCIVNLLDKFPDIAGKTVRGFVCRPYSNVDSCPNDYNVTATLTRELYVRTYGIGFMKESTDYNLFILP